LDAIVVEPSLALLWKRDPNPNPDQSDLSDRHPTKYKLPP